MRGPVAAVAVLLLISVANSSGVSSPADSFIAGFSVGQGSCPTGSTQRDPAVQETPSGTSNPCAELTAQDRSIFINSFTRNTKKTPASSKVGEKLAACFLHKTRMITKAAHARYSTEQMEWRAYPPNDMVNLARLSRWLKAFEEDEKSLSVPDEDEESYAFKGAGKLGLLSLQNHSIGGGAFSSSVALCMKAPFVMKKIGPRGAMLPFLGGCGCHGYASMHFNSRMLDMSVYNYTHGCGHEWLEDFEETHLTRQESGGKGGKGGKGGSLIMGEAHGKTLSPPPPGCIAPDTNIKKIRHIEKFLESTNSMRKKCGKAEDEQECVKKTTALMKAAISANAVGNFLQFERKLKERQTMKQFIFNTVFAKHCTLMKTMSDVYAAWSEEEDAQSDQAEGKDGKDGKDGKGSEWM